MRVVLLIIVFIFLILAPFLAFSESKIGVLGDSNTFWKYIESEEDVFYRVAEKNLREQGYDIRFIPFKYLSGLATSQNGFSRLEKGLEEHPDIEIMIICLGLNDVKDATPFCIVYYCLECMIKYCLDRNIVVILGTVDVSWFPHHKNHAEYKRDFINIYYDLAKKYKIHLFPFVCKEIFTSNNMIDLLHPNSKGHLLWSQIIENTLKPLILRNRLCL